jgi:arginase family enzyme
MPHYLAKTGVGLSVAEVNPDHDPELQKTERLAEEIVQSLAKRTAT